jgi:hypothetical protein
LFVDAGCVEYLKKKLVVVVAVNSGDDSLP